MNPKPESIEGRWDILSESAMKRNESKYGHSTRDDQI